MRLILDTVTFLWAVSTPEHLSRAAMSALRRTTAVREISVVSLTEIAVKQTRGKLTFGKAEAMAGAGVKQIRCGGVPIYNVSASTRATGSGPLALGRAHRRVFGLY